MFYVSLICRQHGVCTFTVARSSGPRKIFVLFLLQHFGSFFKLFTFFSWQPGIASLFGKLMLNIQ
jgi:hypothetical protein